MSYHCFKCQAKQDFSDPSRVGRRDCCSKCNADLHVCLNCKHYDPSAYNLCREPQAERVLDKDRSNYCDYFAFREGQDNRELGKALQGPGQSDRKGKLDDLFKK